jgi:hypothetical protein
MRKNQNGKKSSKPRSQFPPGWNQKRIDELVAHYDSQSDDERAAEIEAAAEAQGQTLISVPTKLIPDVLKLIKRRQKKRLSGHFH